MQSILKICGLFAISHEMLQNVLIEPDTPIANLESIEQMKFIELGATLGAFYLDTDYPSVNLEKDLHLVNTILHTDVNQKQILQSIL